MGSRWGLLTVSELDAKNGWLHWIFFLMGLGNNIKMASKFMRHEWGLRQLLEKKDYSHDKYTILLHGYLD